MVSLSPEPLSTEQQCVCKLWHVLAEVQCWRCGWSDGVDGSKRTMYVFLPTPDWLILEATNIIMTVSLS